METIKRLVALHDNYEPNAAIPELVTHTEIQEEEEFLYYCLETKVMKLLCAFLMKHKLFKSNLYWKEIFRDIWFGRWSEGSCAFEHIFLGEFKRNKVSGVHNWVFFLLQESREKVDYYGFDKALDFGRTSKGQGRGGIVTTTFGWENGGAWYQKPYSSLFIGLSPEMELALYTLGFFLKPGGIINISLGGSKIDIQTHAFRTRDKTYLSSAFPRITQRKLQLNEIVSTNVAGNVIFFNRKKGYGFIKIKDCAKKVFVHRSENAGHKLKPGDFLIFDIKIGLKGHVACHVDQETINENT